MKAFNEVAEYFCGPVCQALKMVPQPAKALVTEIRLRLECPVCLDISGKTRFLSRSGALLPSPAGDCLVASRPDLDETLMKICGYSVHSCADSLKQGYYTVKGGHRAGIVGTVTAESGKVSAFLTAEGINFRIARSVPGAAGGLTGLYTSPCPPSLLIAGPPLTGKTTVLKDLVRRLSSGETGRYFKISVVDERGELGGRELGPCTDLLRGYPKGEGMEIALRSMSPDLLVCDEIGNEEETRAILNSLRGGAAVLATIHAASLDDIRARPAAQELLRAGAFTHIVFLRPGRRGEIRLIFQLNREGEQDGSDRGGLSSGGGAYRERDRALP